MGFDWEFTDEVELDSLELCDVPDGPGVPNEPELEDLVGDTGSDDKLLSLDTVEELALEGVDVGIEATEGVG